MKKTISLIALSLLLGCSFSEAHEGDDSPEAKILQRDFNRMMEWFPGRYDNQEQVMVITAPKFTKD